MSVTDGDTIAVAPAGDRECPLAIRLYGIDAPETRQAGGEESTAYLLTLLPLDAVVDVIPMDTDRYGRTVALVVHAGRVVNGSMVAAGHAWVYAKYCRAAMCKAWYQLQKEAAANGAGLWQEDEPVAPWQWRQEQKEK